MLIYRFLRILSILTVVAFASIVNAEADQHAGELKEAIIGADGSVSENNVDASEINNENARFEEDQRGSDAPIEKSEETETKNVETADVEDPNCPSRGHIIKCVGKYLDSDEDGKLSRNELDNALKGLPWYGRGILKLLGSTDKMMEKCDVDKDDFISMDFDMTHNSEKCLATCFKRRAFKSSFFSECDL